MYQIVGSRPILGKQIRRGYRTSPELGTGTKLEIVENVVILEHLKVKSVVIGVKHLIRAPLPR